MRGMIVIMLMALSVVAGQAQETRKLTRQEKKEMQARLDSLLHVEAEEAVNARDVQVWRNGLRYVDHELCFRERRRCGGAGSFQCAGKRS